MDRSLQPPETTYYDRVSIVRAEQRVPLDLWNELEEKRKTEEDGHREFAQFRQQVAAGAAQAFMTEMAEQDLLLFRQTADDEETFSPSVKMVLEAVVIGGNGQIVRDAYRMAKEVTDELGQRRALKDTVDLYQLQNVLAEKIAEVLHNERPNE